MADLDPNVTAAMEVLRTKLKAENDTATKEFLQKELAAFETGKIKSVEDRIAFYDAERKKTDEQRAEERKEIDLMSAEIRRFKEQGLPGASGQVKTIQKQLEEAMSGKVKFLSEEQGHFVAKETTETVKDFMIRLKSVNGQVMPVIVLKAATDPILAINSRSGGSVGLTDFDPTYTPVIQRKPFLRQIITTRPTSKMYVGWAEQNHITGDADMTAEGTSKNQQSFETVERSERVKKITLFDKTSKENLDDLPFMSGEIRTLIIDAIARFLDTQILTGNNSGENLKGLTSYAPAGDLSASPLVNTITAANNKDVIRALCAQIAVNGKGNFIPDYFLINPWDAAAMDMSKTSEGLYVMAPFQTPDGTRICGAIGIENTGVTQDKVMLGDFRFSNLAIREDIVISMGYDGNDFTKNLVTMLGEMRALHYVKTNHVNAFAYGDFSLLKGQLDPTATSV
jgi:hypothetical protein